MAEEFGRRAEDQGQESTRDILIGLRSDVKFYLRNQEKHEKEDEKKFDDLDRRTKGLELREARVIGGAGVVAFIVALLVRMFK